jgi:histidyl-tRNA synthetase
VERLALLLADPPPAPRPLAVVPADAEAGPLALTLTDRLRRAWFTVDLGYTGTLGKRMKRANRINARAAVILGAEERAAGAATVRDLDSGDQTQVPLDQLEAGLDAYR